MLAAVFRFSGPEVQAPHYLIYSYKRGAFYPFILARQKRAHAQELRAGSLLSSSCHMRLITSLVSAMGLPHRLKAARYGRPHMFLEQVSGIVGEQLPGFFQANIRWRQDQVDSHRLVSGSLVPSDRTCDKTFQAFYEGFRVALRRRRARDYPCASSLVSASPQLVLPLADMRMITSLRPPSESGQIVFYGLTCGNASQLLLTRLESRPEYYR